MADPKRAAPPGALQHMSLGCPVNPQMDVEPMPVGRLFEGTRRTIVIPIFQRRYCWRRKQIDDWWRDLLHARGDMLVGHRLGKCLFARCASTTTEPDAADDLLCVDGQQRLTTTFLLLASVRDAVLASGLADRELAARDALRRAEAVLYDAPWDPTVRDACAAVSAMHGGDYEWEPASVSYRWPEGALLRPCRLTPSYPDRAPFYELVTVGRAWHDKFCGARCTTPPSSSTTGESCWPLWRGALRERPACLLTATKQRFDELVKRFVLDATAASPRAKAEKTKWLVDRCLDFFSIMFLRCQPDVHLPQLFLWTQEKTLFSMDTLLHNPTPGQNFRFSDFVRNLLLSPIVDRPETEQHAFYARYWVPLEATFGGDPARFDAFLADFTASVTDKEARQPGALEAHMLEIMQFLGISSAKRGDAIRYAQFVTYWEARLLEDAGGPRKDLRWSQDESTGNDGGEEAETSGSARTEQHHSQLAAALLAELLELRLRGSTASAAADATA